jgi:hypothetical protein
MSFDFLGTRPLFKALCQRGSTSGTSMQLAQLLSQLTQHAALDLVFEFDHGPIHKDYHLTEVLRVQVDAIDCGGTVDRWSETVLQLLEPQAENGMRYMAAGKALAILTGSHEQIELDAASEVLLEYKYSAASAAQRFHIDTLQVTPGQLRVKVRGTATQCKAAERSQSKRGASTSSTSNCCTPSANETPA